MLIVERWVIHAASMVAGHSTRQAIDAYFLTFCDTAAFSLPDDETVDHLDDRSVVFESHPVDAEIGPAELSHSAGMKPVGTSSFFRRQNDDVTDDSGRQRGKKIEPPGR